MKDLNKLAIPCDVYNTVAPLKDYSTVATENFTEVRAIFRDHEKFLIDKINEYYKGAIFGCVAWLTSEPILRALAKCPRVQIVVQKEDFLRPEGKASTWKNNLRYLYSGLRCNLMRQQMKEPLCSLSTCSDPTVEPIRCVGNHNRDKVPAFPRSHHKFFGVL